MSGMLRWLAILLSGKPHFVIGNQDDPYMLRWYLIPRNPWINVYLHKFMRDDDDRALHDHPWWFVSLMVHGTYSEQVKDGSIIKRRSPSIAYRPAEHQHRVELKKRTDGSSVPCWTIVMTGPKQREWGFWCPKGFVVWTRFVDRTNHGSVGRGCE